MLRAAEISPRGVRQIDFGGLNNFLSFALDTTLHRADEASAVGRKILLSVERASHDPLSPRGDHTESGCGPRFSPICLGGPRTTKMHTWRKNMQVPAHTQEAAKGRA